jgi:protein transport protein SEC24
LPTGGQIVAFQHSHPTDLPDRPKSEQEVTNTDKERALFAPGSLKWTELAEECAEAGVGVSLWLFPSQFIDIGTIGERFNFQNSCEGAQHFSPGT